MNEKTIKLLQEYNSELFKLGILPKEIEGLCGSPGLSSILDEHTRLFHLKWLIDDTLDNIDNLSQSDLDRTLGYIQGVLWCAKFRSNEEIKKENEDLNAED